MTRDWHKNVIIDRFDYYISKLINDTIFRRIYILKAIFLFSLLEAQSTRIELDARILSTRITILVNRWPTCGREHMAIISPPLPSLILLFSPTARGYVAYVAISPYLYSLFRFLSFLFSLSPIRSVPIFLLPFFIIPLSPLLAHLLYIPHGRASPHVTLQQVQQLNCARRFSTESKSAIFHIRLFKLL